MWHQFCLWKKNNNKKNIHRFLSVQPLGSHHVTKPLRLSSSSAIRARASSSWACRSAVWGVPVPGAADRFPREKGSVCGLCQHRFALGANWHMLQVNELAIYRTMTSSPADTERTLFRHNKNPQTNDPPYLGFIPIKRVNTIIKGLISFFWPYCATKSLTC